MSSPMASLAWKIGNALDESRMLMLGTQVLIGFHCTGVLEPGFKDLGPVHRAAMLVGLVLLLVAATLLMLVAAHHRIACRGEDEPSQLLVSDAAMHPAFAAFAITLGLDVFISGSRIVGDASGAAIGALLTAVAVALWFLWPLRARSQGHPPMPASKALENKVRNVLTEARVTLPGAQALLGFCTIAVLIDGFKELPRALQLAHLAALTSIGLAVCLLLAPAAYHRIVEGGEATERFHRVASRLVLTAMGPLALALSLALWIVAERITRSRAAGLSAGITLLIVELGLWFGWTTWRRQTHAHPARQSRAHAHPRSA
jgi:hypothetical protein